MSRTRLLNQTFRGLAYAVVPLLTMHCQSEPELPPGPGNATGASTASCTGCSGGASSRGTTTGIGLGGAAGALSIGGLAAVAGSTSSSSGVVFGFSCIGVADGTLAAWLSSHTVAMAGTWNEGTADDQLSQTTLRNEYGNWNKPIDVAIGAIFGDESWAQAAEGQFDARWSQAIDAMKSAWGTRDPALLKVRFAHEFNLDRSDWRVSGDEVNEFKQAWQRFYTIFKSRLPKASLVWCPNDGTSGSLGLDVRKSYPGSDYVDIICIDTYNQYPWVNSKSEFDAKLSGTNSDGSPLGAESWRQWAAQQGKPLAIGEWANNGDPGGEGGGGDSPDYIQRFHDWLYQHGGNGPGQITYAVFFNYWTQFQVYPSTMQTNAATRVRSLF